MISLTEKLANLPSRPGVYLMRDKGGKVVYVGKAKDLRARVRVYFNNADERSQIQFLLRRVEDIETLVTGSDKEALILENNLIKQYKPRYNIRLKDDKSYLSIKVTTQHPWPRIFATRKIVKDGNRYFGPFSSAVAARETIDIIEKHFLLRNCTDHNFRNRTRPCLQYQIKRCLAPCVLPVSSDEYREQVRQAMLFIEGRQQELISELKQRMQEKAAALEFEDREDREEYLAERKSRKINILNPQRGDKRQLVEMAAENARQSFFERHDQEKAREKMLRELQFQLHLKQYPHRIECFDISTIHGAHAVGSMVTFINGEADKARYRHYRIRTIDPSSGGDDFGMMLEILKRRFLRGTQEADLPDLVVVDGGKGQLAMALAAMAEVGVTGVEAVGLAKMRVQAAARSAEIQRLEERVFLPGQSNPVVLKRNSNALFLLQRVRDEAHRFAITYHKKLRTKQTLYSALDKIPGVGGVRKRALLRAFGSIKRIEEATVEDLLQVPSVNEKIAREIFNSLHAEPVENAPDDTQQSGT